MKTLVTLATVLAITTTSSAAEPVRADIEVDPTAYALSGHSIHAGIAWGHLRFDLGNFAMAVPQWFHGNEDFDVSFDGYGAKVHYFLRRDQTGLFGGLGFGIARVRAEVVESGRAAEDLQLSSSVEVGYRLALPHGFHATAWLGVGAASLVDPVMLDGKTFESPRLQVFPAIHLGYRFR